MPNSPLQDQVARLVSEHGAAAVNQSVADHVAGRVGAGAGKAAGAYITSIITGDQAFDEGVLAILGRCLGRTCERSLTDHETPAFAPVITKAIEVDLKLRRRIRTDEHGECFAGANTRV